MFRQFLYLQRKFLSTLHSRLEKITSKQFKNAYLAVMKDIQDPDLGDRIGSNWNTVYNSIVTSVNS